MKKWICLICLATFSCLITLGLPGQYLSRTGMLTSFSPALAIESPPAQISQTSSAQSLLNKGIEHFQAERYREAITSWQQALNAYTNSSDEQHQALVLSNLSLAYQHLGQWEDAETSLNESLAFFEHQSEENRSLIDWEYYAKVLNAQGWLLWRRGQPELALDAWRETTLAYEAANHFPGIVGSQINQAKALQSLGSSVAAKDILDHVQVIIQQQDNPQLQFIALQSLGNALRRVGKLDDSEEVLKDGLKIITENQAEFSSIEHRNAVQSSILLDLGNTERAQWERAVALNLDEAETYKNSALDHYQESEAIAPSFLPRTQAIANRLSLLVDIQEVDHLDTAFSSSTTWQEIQDLWDALRTQYVTRFDHTGSSELAGTYPGRSDIEVQLNSVNSLLKLLAINPLTNRIDSEMWAELSQVLAQSIQHARQLDDQRTEALALGQLGHLYEQVHQLADAKSVTEEAIALSESIQASDIQYRWEWQLGRILKRQNKPDIAIRMFDQSVTTLEQVRKDLLFIDSDVQFSFRDDVEPLYRQFVDLLLSDYNAGNENLRQVTELIDSLQLAELENYLGCNIDPVQLSEKVIDPTAAIVYPIILRDSLTEQQPERLEVILQRPDQSFQRSTTPLSSGEFEDLTTRLYNELPVPTRWRSAQQDAGQLYNWLIRPFESVVNAEPKSSTEQSINTLVFVLDGALRNIPMSVLWDGDRQQYLLERYAIAIAPSLQVVEPQPLRHPIKVLAAGSSEALDHPFRDEKFSPLQNVEKELNAIRSLESLQGSRISADILFNDTFTKAALEQQLQRETYSIVHLASHGVFSSDPERTFIALPNPNRVNASSDEENYAIFSNDLDTLLRTRDQEGNTIELLVLSACQTATGDDRATLGLAGLTVRAGARSTLATLWSVDDESAAVMMEEFYRQLTQHPNISRAEALRQAQLNLWEKGVEQLRNWKRPYFWSPYVIVGNWL